jgi:hypothetical protein
MNFWVKLWKFLKNIEKNINLVVKYECLSKILEKYWKVVFENKHNSWWNRYHKYPAIAFNQCVNIYMYVHNINI